MITTSVFDRNLRAYKVNRARTIINQGGTSSSKTFSILQLLAIIASRATAKCPLLISIVSESLPHLKRGCIRDFKNVLGDTWRDDRYNKTDHIYDYDNAKIEFFPADESGKQRGGRRDILFLNEANRISKDIRDELEVRTRLCEFIDYNPVSEFWAHELVGCGGVEFIHSTYLDARPVLPAEIVTSIESRRDKDPNWWRVYGLGEIGKLDGLIHPTFSQCERLPDGGAEFYGLDFGSVDPTALVRCSIIGEDLFSEELVYESGLRNTDLATRMESLGVRKRYDEIYADSARPEHIDELCLYGYNVKAAPKGAGSVEHGIQLVNQYRQHWTKSSLSAIKEQRNYRYIEDRNGKVTEKPMDDYNHAMDARRYALAGKIGTQQGWSGLVAF